jgi:hypothetical protein
VNILRNGEIDALAWLCEKYELKLRDVSRERESSEQFVWLNRRYGETETQFSRSAITPQSEPIRVEMK